MKPTVISIRITEINPTAGNLRVEENKKRRKTYVKNGAISNSAPERKSEGMGTTLFGGLWGHDGFNAAMYAAHL